MLSGENIFEVIANYTYDWETWFSQTGEVRWINPAVQRMTGYSVEECLAMPHYPLPILHPDDREDMRALLDFAAKGSSGNDVEFRILRRNGDLAWGAISWQPISGAGGERMGFRTSVRDISQRKQAEEALTSAMKEAETANLAKTRFLAAVSHDLRQPMQAISLFVDALSQMTEDEKACNVLENIRLCLLNGNELLDDLVDISRLDAGVVIPKLRDLAIADIFESLERSFSTVASERGLQLTFVPTSQFCTSDPVILTRILQNLISNAIRYTPEGRVLVGCRRRGERISIQVWDTGIGITTEHMNQIFEEFYQIHNPQRDRRQGVGLGLAIVKRQAKLLGAEIEARSWPNRGSSFGVVLPQAAPDRETMALSEAEFVEPDLAGVCLVAIDDEPQQLHALSSFLALKGIDVVSGESESAAIAEIDKSGCKPQVIVADYRLKGDLTGADAINRIRDYLGSPVPGIIITGDTEPQRIAEAEASGFRLLHKPVQSDSLLRAVRESILESRPGALS
jgi:PAS domain S-box-containing protein